MKIWAVLNATHLEVIRVFGYEEAADEYATYSNMRSDEDHFIHKGFEVDESEDELYDFTYKDIKALKSDTRVIPMGGNDYIEAFGRKIAYNLASKIRRVYCIVKTINYCSSIDFYRSERIAEREFRVFNKRHPETKIRIFDEDHPEVNIQLRGYFVEG